MISKRPLVLLVCVATAAFLAYAAASRRAASRKMPAAAPLAAPQMDLTKSASAMLSSLEALLSGPELPRRLGPRRVRELSLLRQRISALETRIESSRPPSETELAAELQTLQKSALKLLARAAEAPQ